MPAFILAIFLSAFLLFQVQPIIARYILPWYGGSPAVWTTCMLFFQIGLLAGYSYAHLLVSRFRERPHWQAGIHLFLLIVALLPPSDHAFRKPQAHRCGSQPRRRYRAAPARHGGPALHRHFSIGPPAPALVWSHRRGEISLPSLCRFKFRLTAGPPDLSGLFRAKPASRSANRPLVGRLRSLRHPRRRLCLDLPALIPCPLGPRRFGQFSPRRQTGPLDRPDSLGGSRSLRIDPAPGDHPTRCARTWPSFPFSGSFPSAST